MLEAYNRFAQDRLREKEDSEISGGQNEFLASGN
jgi:hypothetical protein